MGGLFGGGGWGAKGMLAPSQIIGGTWPPLPPPALPTPMPYIINSTGYGIRKIKFETQFKTLNFLTSYASRGWSGGAMVLGKLQVPERPSNLDYSRGRVHCTCSRCE